MIQIAENNCQEHTAIDSGEDRKKGATKYKSQGVHQNLFQALLASDLPADEKLPGRMAHEGFEILLAGSDTTARTMGVAVYHITANFDIMIRLQKELEGAMPDPHCVIDLKLLENLPWLVRELLHLTSLSQKS